METKLGLEAGKHWANQLLDQGCGIHKGTDIKGMNGSMRLKAAAAGGVMKTEPIIEIMPKID